jgi:hypothetical protein
MSEQRGQTKNYESSTCARVAVQLGVFHVPTLTPAGCGLLLYSSYSFRTERTLYISSKNDAALAARRCRANIGSRGDRNHLR